MAVLRYLTHPQVAIDPHVPVPDWSLNAVGVARVAAWAGAPVFAKTTRVVCSTERKAVETAAPIARSLGIEAEPRARMGENDRSATGFLPPKEFETMADRFFAEPDVSVCGWEAARAAQARVVAEARQVIDGADTGDLLFVGHGAVGTLLWCHFAGLAIDRRADQPAGGGNIWAVSLPECRPLHPWRPAEALVAGG